MATTCTYRFAATDVLTDPAAALSLTHEAPEGATTRLYCTKPATHVSLTHWDHLSVWTSVPAAQPVGWGHARKHIPDFCAAHAEVVSAARMARRTGVRHG
jgi:hypothetical protein